LYGYADADRDLYTNGDAHLNTHSDPDFNLYSNCHQYLHSDANFNTYPNCNPYRYSDTNGNIHTDGYINVDPNTNRYIRWIAPIARHFL
jgi:hypothetical protein